MIRWAIGILALGAQVVFAQTFAQQGGAGIPPGLAQKQVFARSLVEDASVVKRIQESQDVEAQRLLTSAGENYSGALAALAGGDFASADKQFNEAMAAIGKARRRVPDVAAFAAKQRADYQKLLESVESLQRSYLSYFKRAKPSTDSSANETGEESLGVVKLLDAAKAHAKDGKISDALRVLETAEPIIRSALERILSSSLLEYTQQFETPAEEYAYELERNRSYLELMPVAIAELKPTGEAKLTIESLIEQNRLALDRARGFVRQQDYTGALAIARAGTGYLRLALSAAGLTVPQE